MDKKMFVANVAKVQAKRIDDAIKAALGPILYRQLAQEMQYTIASEIECAMVDAYKNGVGEAEYRALVIRSDEAASRKDAFLKAFLSDESKAMTKEQRELYALKAFAGIDVLALKDNG